MLLEMHTLAAPSFIVMVVYGAISLPIYLLTVIAILDTKCRKGSFFRIYILMAIVNIVAYLNKFLIIRLPLFTCGQCGLAPLFQNTSYWWLESSLFIHWQIMQLQLILSVTIASDRFIVIVLSGSISTFWRTNYKYFLGIVFAAPFIFTWPLLTSESKYIYLPAGDNFRVEPTTADLEWQYDCLIAVQMVSAISNIFLNFGVLVYFCLGKLKLQGAQHSTEMKLFINSVVEAATQITTTILTLYQRLFISSDAVSYDQSRVVVLFALDAMTLLPPFVLLITCQEVRHWMFFTFMKRKDSQVRSEFVRERTGSAS